MTNWLNDPQRATRVWLSKHTVAVAWVGLIAALLLPPHGLSVSLCWIQDATGIPCPGCGLTRSLSCGIRGMFANSFQYHPMGLMILALFLFTSIQSISPASLRSRVAQFLQSHAIAVNLFYIMFALAFVSFGIARAVAELFLHLHRAM